jgi:hypothetical protein
MSNIELLSKMIIVSVALGATLIFAGLSIICRVSTFPCHLQKIEVRAKKISNATLIVIAGGACVLIGIFLITQM